MPSYFQILLIFACALPVPSAGSHFTDMPQATGIAFADLSLGPATAADIEVTWPSVRAVPADIAMPFTGASIAS